MRTTVTAAVTAIPISAATTPAAVPDRRRNLHNAINETQETVMLTAIAGAKYATVNMKTTNPRGMEKPVELTMCFGHVMIQPTTPTTTNECNPRIVATGQPVLGADAPAAGRGEVADIASPSWSVVPDASGAEVERP
jgi:hypothetical protein